MWKACGNCRLNKTRVFDNLCLRMHAIFLRTVTDWSFIYSVTEKFLATAAKIETSSVLLVLERGENGGRCLWGMYLFTAAFSSQSLIKTPTVMLKLLKASS